MFNRRMFVALAACLAISASSAFAGNHGGSKKDATIKVRNGSSDTLFAFVDVSAQAIQKAANQNNTPGVSQSDPDAILTAFNNLGGKQIAPGGNASFSVKGGNHRVTVIDIETAQQVFVDRSIFVPAHETVKINVDDADLPAPPPT